MLLKTDIDWQWDKNTDKVFEQIKTTVSILPVLKLLYPLLQTVLSVDASPIDVGAVIIDLGQSLEFASRTLTDTQAIRKNREETFCRPVWTSIFSSICLMTESSDRFRP